MLRKLLKNISFVFGQSISEKKFNKIAEDRYYTYGVSQRLHELAVLESAEWIHNYIDDCIIFDNKRKLYSYAVECLQRFRNQDDLLYLEFGVHTGTSINFFAKGISKQLYGFDTFEGMPEDWKGWNVKKGQFTMNGKFPEVQGNVELIKGLIQDTLPGFLAKHPDKKIAFIHIDTDIYAPAKTVLNLCKNRLVPGSIILFDEIHSYTSWKSHEYKALQEELQEENYKFIAFSDYKQGMIEIIR
jgi:hypothetical protein